MIYIITAMYAEARAFITHFQLKKDISHTRFQVFLNSEANICLIISGPGSVPAAAAVSSICTKYSAGQGDFLLNVGICAQIWDENGHLPEYPCQTGRIFLCNKIRELSSGKTFYPDILYRHMFAEAQIITGPKTYEKMSPVTTYPFNDQNGQCLKSDKMLPSPTTCSDSIEANCHAQSKSTGNSNDQFSQQTELYAETTAITPKDAEFFLYDMEAAAVYQAGSYFFGPHQMIFLKIISDGGNTGTVTPEQVKHLIAQKLESIADYITNLQSIAQEEHPDEIFQKDSTRKAVEKLCLDLHCSRVMSESVRQHLRYCMLAGTDYASVAKEMYQEGKLPCKDKREGKQCFEELKERLL